MDSESLKQLLEIGRQMAETRELDPLLGAATSMALRFVGAECGYIALLAGDSLDVRAGRDKSGNDIQMPQTQISRATFDQVIATGKASITADAINSLETGSALDLPIRSVMCAPLIARGEILGAIYLENHSQGNLFDAESLSLLEHFAAQAAISIQNALLNDELEARVAAHTQELAAMNAKLQQLAISDELTHLYNRRYFFDLAQREVAKAIRYQHPISLILLDIDHFKRFNDQYGHDVGDQVLQNLADYVRQCVRETDLLARYGGEEFVILLPNTRIEDAVYIADRICYLIQTRPMTIAEQPFFISVSQGVAACEVESQPSTDTIDALIERADIALHAAKDAGRNRVMRFVQGEEGA
ncbi:sensor domain-containing diguanylate cyclase [Chloroflexales bacterium ZM16-3]|nr:sensor domain-containing diguanylate cyclase [Chloroflexales bacterium ZM16-3]